MPNSKLRTIKRRCDTKDLLGRLYYTNLIRNIFLPQYLEKRFARFGESLAELSVVRYLQRLPKEANENE